MLITTLQDLFKRYRRPGDIVFALLFLVFAIFLASQLGEQVQLAKRTKWFAQPSLWPSVAVYGMLLFGALHCLGSLLSQRIPGRWGEVALWFRSLEFVAYFIIYVLAVPKLGYLSSTILFAMFLTWRCGFRNRLMLGLAALFGFVVVVVFRGFLQVKIPGGAVYEYLPESIRLFALTYL